MSSAPATGYGRPLLYREDMPEVRKRLTHWWNGGDIGRPAMLLTSPREEPLEDLPEMAPPEGWVTHYSISSYEYRKHLARVGPAGSHYFGEAVPAVSPDLAPNCLALYLGCEGVDMPGTVWCRPFIEDPDQAVFEVDEENIYWQFTLRLGRAMKEISRGRNIIQFPDLIEGLDTLEAMRGGENLLMDLIDRPEWVHACLERITELYFHYYDRLFEMFKDETGGSLFWAWAPGRMCKLQCDFSAMIGPEMFGEFMVPVLERMTRRFDHCMYHWDGPGAIPHHDHLLALDHLDMIQWTPGAGTESCSDPRWFPLYHKTLEAGKKLMTHGVANAGDIRRFKDEFGEGFKQFLITGRAASVAEAEELVRLAEL